MKEMVYTLAAWRVQEGRQQAFISAWKDLGEAFHALSDMEMRIWRPQALPHRFALLNRLMA